jgi:hypothetical protein
LVLQHLVGRHRLAIDTNQVVCGRTIGHLVAEQLFDGRALGDFDEVGEACAIVIDVEDREALHACSRESV